MNASLHSVGRIPWSNAALNYKVRDGEISLANSFRYLVGTKSGQDALYGLSLFSNFLTLFIVTVISGMIGLLGDVMFGQRWS